MSRRKPNNYLPGETRSYRDEITPELLEELRLDQPQKMQLYLEFVQECPGASEDTQRKMRKRLGIE